VLCCCCAAAVLLLCFALLCSNDNAPQVDHIVPAKQGGMGWVFNYFLMPKVGISNRFSFHTTK
jgi:uncharacterized membrane protein YjjB (DUF3815 family)